ncbi:MbtH family protein [Streptomyces subrutilus]|uniref:MbtH family protein n=1 Tax=Streptomyces subrutilus TaxID=36818 RepID=A0A5P2UGR2_9ACTN|nr:MbtH family NRPS accessory protein [Streptomyces subrutilus]QEU77619.1 MbtH family protein [Streptomyces subrutilus]WSJ33286.1 MbtH family NRPS accessory protein [Streptomyces subrutilus]GGZ64699.1 MbtH protein [Streptomyces subrutilus]
MHETSPQQFLVVANEEEQYSLWEAGRPVPLGWHEQGVRGTREECLEHIERVWTDMRPRSLRVSTAG